LDNIRSAAVETPCLDAGDDCETIQRRINAYVAQLRKTLRAAAEVFRGSYVTYFVVRKFLLARLCTELGLGAAQWQTLTLLQLREWSADANDHLACLPAEWTAKEVSAFVCGREDWPMFASMFTCLWGEAAAASCRDADETAGEIEATLPRLKAAAVQARAASAGALHPSVLLQKVGVRPTQTKRSAQAAAEPPAVRKRPGRAAG
jgi:hypothetical protein